MKKYSNPPILAFLLYFLFPRRLAPRATFPSVFFIAPISILGWYRCMRRCIFVFIAAAGIPLCTAGPLRNFDHPAGTNSVQAFTWGGSIYRELLEDRNFANGFRAFWTASSFDAAYDPSLQLGNITANYVPYIRQHLYPDWGYVCHAWGPDLANNPGDNGKYWDFNEGKHEDFFDEWGKFYPPGRDSNGNKVWDPANDLAVHRIEVNAECTGCDSSNPSFLLLNSFNQYPTHSWTRDLVRTAYTNRTGGLYTYMNTANEIHNVAKDNCNPEYSGGPCNSLDTWPHFYVGQNFRRLIDLATLNTVTFRAKFRVWSIPSLTPVPGPGPAYADAIYGVGFTLRRKDNPYAVIFLGYHLYAVGVDPNWAYHASPGVDQSGQNYFNGDTINDLGGPLVPNDNAAIFDGGTVKTIELRRLFNEAISAGAPFGAFEDYYLAAVGVGWETLGYEEIRSQISDVSLQGETNPFFDPDVFQDNYYAAQFNWTGGGALGMERAHWLQYGINDGWRASAKFWAPWYRDQNKNAIVAAYGSATNRNAIFHYISHGRGEGKPGAPP